MISKPGSMTRAQPSPRVVSWLGIAICGVVALNFPAARSQEARPDGDAAGAHLSNVDSPAGSAERALLNKYCVTCHNQRLLTGGLTLETLNVENVGRDAEVWEKVVRKVKTGAMPPSRMPRPEADALRTFVSRLETSLDRAGAASPNPGRVPIHRLNQSEYTNTIHDLLALDVDGRKLLGVEDAGEDGFDNMAGDLSVSSALVERYMAAARTISRLAVGDPTIVPVFETYNVPQLLVQDDRTSEDLPFGSRGGTAVHYRFPVDGEYSVRIRLRRAYEYIIGMGRTHQLEVRLDGKRLKLFTVGGNAPGKPAPATFAGEIPGDPEWENFMHTADAGLEIRFTARAGTRVVGVSFVDDSSEPEGVVQPRQTGATGLAFNIFYDANPAVEMVSVGGPFRVDRPGDTASRRSIFVCHPIRSADEESCATKILSTLARRAYRRPVTDLDLYPLLRFYAIGRKEGGFDAGIQLALERILTSPAFLFRIERDPPGSAPGAIYRLSDLELASRLSFFLWSTIPDEELLDLASRKQLRVPGVLERQVRRMLMDSRSEALAHNFANQWLELPRLKGVMPDQNEFPDFDENLRAAFQRETELFVENQISSNKSIVELLSADYTFLNERLALHYHIPNVYGDGFRRVTFDNGERGGLLGQGSILTVTSYANRTSPVLRGKWLLDNILDMSPPPPPPDVPALKESGTNSKLASVRERMEEHRKNPGCAVCHLQMDPLGFALENFDAIGQWHTIDTDGRPIDVSGSLPDGTQFQGVVGLRKLLLSRRDQFAAALTKKLLAWALGRSIEYFDLPAVRKIMRDAAGTDYRWASLIEGIVTSTPFQMSQVKSFPPPATSAARMPSRFAAQNGKVTTTRVEGENASTVK
jgi:hypothetical protein